MPPLGVKRGAPSSLYGNVVGLMRGVDHCAARVPLPTPRPTDGGSRFRGIYCSIAYIGLTGAGRPARWLYRRALFVGAVYGRAWIKDPSPDR